MIPPTRPYGSIVLLTLALLVQCGTNDDGTSEGLLRDNTLTVGSETRSYLLYVPANQSNSPLVILLHGGGDSAEGLLGLDRPGRAAPYRRWIDLADQNNLVLAIPNGTLGTAAFRGWNDCRSDADNLPESDDVFFITMMMDAITERFSIDPSRIYVTGSSNGGHLALRLAEEVPDRLAAVGVILAAASASNQCEGQYVPLSILFMNGTDDPILPYEGGEMASNRGRVLSMEESLQIYTNRNATPNPPDTVLLPDISSDDGSHVRKLVWDDGREGTEVVLFEVIGGGHTEPSLTERYSEVFKALVGGQNADVEMADEVWDFFKDKQRL